MSDCVNSRPLDQASWSAARGDNENEFEHHDDHVAVSLREQICEVEMNCTSCTGNSEAGVNTAMFLHNKKVFPQNYNIRSDLMILLLLWLFDP